MKHATYLAIMRDVLGLPADATHEQMKAEAIRRMEDADYEVVQDQMPDHRFRVRVRRRVGRQWTYNEHTTSTSGYPILAAYEKWQRATGGAK